MFLIALYSTKIRRVAVKSGTKPLHPQIGGTDPYFLSMSGELKTTPLTPTPKPPSRPPTPRAPLCNRIAH
jgi:hypothetical protein